MEFSFKKIANKQAWRLALTKNIATLMSKLQLALGSCQLCQQPCQSQAMLCDYCTADLTKFISPLSQGASPRQQSMNLLYWPAIHQLFKSCDFDQLVAVAPYLWPYDHWLPQLKYQGRFDLAPLLGNLLYQTWQQHSPVTINDQPTVIPVPLHPSKWQQRGYNQAHLLAKNFAQRAQLPYQSNMLLRVRKTQDQVGQSGASRRKNLRQAFALNAKIAELPKNIVLIDDVVTTGTTCDEIAKLLKQHGVNTVTVLSVCISLPKGSTK